MLNHNSTVKGSIFIRLSPQETSTPYRWLQPIHGAIGVGFLSLADFAGQVVDFAVFLKTR